MSLNTDSSLKIVEFKENKPAAILWFALSALVALMPLIGFSETEFLLLPSFLGLILILYLKGRQCVNSLRMEYKKFKGYTRGIALFVAIYASISMTLINSV